MTRRRSGFSLAELLVTIAMVAILASLLLPAIASTRHSARLTRCSSNLRQFGLAARMYWDDHAGALFRYRGRTDDTGDLFWFGWLERGEEGKRAFDPTMGALWPYLETRELGACPSLKVSDRIFKLKATTGACGYGYNLSLSAPMDQPPLNIESARRPAGLVIFADAAQVNDFQPPASPDDPMLEEFYYVNRTEPTAHFRHKDTAAAVFADAHVSRERPLPGSIDQRLPQARVGRLAPHLLEFP